MELKYDLSKTKYDLDELYQAEILVLQIVYNEALLEVVKDIFLW